MKDIYDAVTTASVTDNLSAHLGQWSDDWTASFQNDGFATMLAPGWMLGVIEGNSAGVTGWDIADVFPGGAGNWGGSFMTVPAQGKHTEAAKKFAAWLTAPEQQLQAYKNKGTFPSQTEALSSDELLSSTNAFFNNAPAGQILANRAVGIVAPFKGPNYFAVNDAMQSALTEVDVNGGDPAAQWDTFVERGQRSRLTPSQGPGRWVTHRPGPASVGPCPPPRRTPDGHLHHPAAARQRSAARPRARCRAGSASARRSVAGTSRSRPTSTSPRSSCSSRSRACSRWCTRPTCRCTTGT